MNVYRKRYSKATAIEYIQKELHPLMMKSMHSGESSNDLDMIKSCRAWSDHGHHDPVLEPYAELHYGIQWRMTGFIRRWSIMD